MQAAELRKKYLDFFTRHKHTVIASAPLVPQNDASVLFNTAGMQPLVPYLNGQAHPQGKRLVNVQKCLRTVDFEEVGDNTHHTFFLMLGNWSLGDYFKKEAIAWSFTFLTEELGIGLDTLAFTCYEGDAQVPKDTESYDAWIALGVLPERIAYLGKDNFWIAGESGPCGPSSEMFYWTGSGAAPKVFDPTDEQWVEIWNDVFMAYHKDEAGKITPLKQKNVDTGMGFARTLAVLNGKKSAYETDLFMPIIKKIEELSGSLYKDHVRPMRIIADHLRAAVFILAEGVEPSNVDRGYILRRLIRRALRYARLVGLADLAPVAQVVIDIYKQDFAEVAKSTIIVSITRESEKFALTLEKGLKEFQKMVHADISGQQAFLLFQSYGFPLEMTEELADEAGITVDTEGFFAEYEKHQALSKEGADKKFKGGLADLSSATIKLHTATHLLNEALRKVVDATIKQRGSNITPERLRFDFSFVRKLTKEEIKAVEDEVNAQIAASLSVVRKEMPKEEALKLGAQMEFGQKYPDVVSVYFVGKYSMEFCGGPHVKNTKDIGHFRIVKEQSSAAGVRRIKAVVREEPSEIGG